MQHACTQNVTSSFDILTQIMPNISLKYKTKSFKADKDKYETSNNVLEINNGKFVRGFLDKKILGGSTSGLIHRIFNDSGNLHARDFIDNLQNIITSIIIGFSLFTYFVYGSKLSSPIILSNLPIKNVVV